MVNFKLNFNIKILIKLGIGKSSLCKLITNIIKPTNGNLILI
jgi:ABC-type antimicrobial peptide transport system ATPase subunit